MARRKDATDTAYITCPLRRSACNYTESGETVSCDRSGDNTFLVGYTLKLIVNKYDSFFSFYRGISSCEIESIESNKSLAIGDYFHEKIVLVHVPLAPTFDFSKILILLVGVVLLAYVILYFCRHTHCVYCGKKLVISIELCYMCKIYGVQPPDPILLLALKDKGQQLQGTRPERFPGLSYMYHLLRYATCAVLCFMKRGRVQPDNVKCEDELQSSNIDEEHTVNEELKLQNETKNKNKKQNYLPYPTEVIYAAVGRK